MVKLRRVRYLCISKTQGHLGGLQMAQRTRTPVNDIQKQKHQAFDRTSITIFLETEKMTLNVWRAVDDRLRWIQGELKRFERRSQDGEATVQLGAISPRSEEMQIEALKEAYEEPAGMAEENIISAVIHSIWRQRPHLHCDFVPLDQAGESSAKDVIGDKRMRRTQEKFLK